MYGRKVLARVALVTVTYWLIGRLATLENSTTPTRDPVLARADTRLYRPV
jgi:hypothetical protein